MVKQNQNRSPRVPKAARRMKTAKPQPMKRRFPKVDTMGKPGGILSNSTPASYYTTMSNPTWLAMSGKVNHPELGGGVRICGRQLMTFCKTTAGDSQLFASGPADTNSINSILISPDTLNGRLALQARTYDRYVFRKLDIVFVSRDPSTQAGSFAMGYVNDPVFPSPTFATVTNMSPSTNSAFIAPTARLRCIDDMSSLRTYFTLYDATSDASKRLTVQGAFVGAPDLSSIGAIQHGAFYFEYMIDLYQPTLDQGFTLRLTKEEEEMIISRRRSMPAPLTIEDRLRSLLDRVEDLEDDYEEASLVSPVPQSTREPTPRRLR